MWKVESLWDEFAFKSGERAREQGKTMNSNPNKYSTWRWKSFNAGWEDRDRELNISIKNPGK